jgi:hypothetical protein
MMENNDMNKLAMSISPGGIEERLRGTGFATQSLTFKNNFRLKCS